MTTNAPRSIPQPLDVESPYVQTLISWWGIAAATQDKAFVLGERLLEAEAKGYRSAVLDTVAFLLNIEPVDALEIILAQDQ